MMTLLLRDSRRPSRSSVLSLLCALCLPGLPEKNSMLPIREVPCSTDVSNSLFPYTAYPAYTYLDLLTSNARSAGTARNKCKSTAPFGPFPDVEGDPARNPRRPSCRPSRLAKAHSRRRSPKPETRGEASTLWNASPTQAVKASRSVRPA
ncbi:hypothetical protein F4680DRAFT_411481 [Xylaria scruposa]|nr:hypothetical protein F4680DRAFT_411481 [Xylaria scruposa]